MDEPKPKKKTVAEQIKAGLEDYLDALKAGRKLRTTTVRKITNTKDGSVIISRVKNYEDNEPTK